MRRDANAQIRAGGSLMGPPVVYLSPGTLHSGPLLPGDTVLTTPLLAVWGARSHTGTVYGDVLAIWRTYAANVTGGLIDCGHCFPDEAPGPTLEWLLRHFGGAAP